MKHKMAFVNNSSHCGFIGNRRLDEVLASDAAELRQIGGSFQEIADRIDLLIKNSETSAIKQNYNYPILILDSPEIELMGLISTRGFQECPFYSGCNITSSRDYIVRHKKTGSEYK